jgi:hypothetical protein
LRRVIFLVHCRGKSIASLIKDEPRQMTTTDQGLPVNETRDSAGPVGPDGRLLALRCLGIPQVATRTTMSRRRALRHRLAAYCARIRPRNTAELASLVLRMGEEIDTRDRMLDAALRATADSGYVADGRLPG